jgi:tetratricopeptide (TPR) repeat protein
MSKTDIDLLERTITLIQANDALGEEARRAALAPLQARLDALRTSELPAVQATQQVTVLYLDRNSFQPAPKADPEAIRQAGASVRRAADREIEVAGGTVIMPDEDTIIGVWTADDTLDSRLDSASNTAPRRAVEAALAIRQEVADQTGADDRRLFRFRAGLTTGTVPLNTTVTQQSLPVRRAQATQAQADPGVVLITHETYRQVRGIFDVEPLTDDDQPLYRVVSVKAQPFRSLTRSVEGIETRMIGRETEFAALQAHLERLLTVGDAHIVTLLGQAGIGKSRLQYDFENYVELRPDLIWGFKARALADEQNMPYSLFRDLFMTRFNIRSSDSPAIARQKLTQGIIEIAGQENEIFVPFIGQLIGLDFSDHTAMRGIQRDTQWQISTRAAHYIVRLMHIMAQRHPIIIYLEDIHWGDLASLDLLSRIMAACADVSLLVVCMARPLLLERYPAWREITAGTVLALEPLSRADSRALVDEILQRVLLVPDVLREMLAGGCDGNPFYLEEIISWLIDADVILKTEPHWRVAPDQLMVAQIPLTLQGVLHARLDDLKPAERETFEQAVVAGRVFWPSVIQRDDSHEQLAELGKRQMVYTVEPSQFEGQTELSIKHNLLREISYTQINADRRRSYHRHVARWLAAQTGARQREFLGLITEHSLLAQDPDLCIEWGLKAVEHALAVNAPEQAATICDRVLGLLSPAQYALPVARFKLLLGRARLLMGDRDAAQSVLLDNIDQVDDQTIRTQTLRYAAQVAREAGDRGVAGDYADRAVALADTVADPHLRGEARSERGQIYLAVGQFADAFDTFQQAYKVYEAIGDAQGIAISLTQMGFSRLMAGDIDGALPYYERSLKIDREMRNPFGVALALLNIGEIARNKGDLDVAQARFEESLEISQSVGNRTNLTINILNLGLIALERGDYPRAQDYLRDALVMTREQDRVADMIYTLVSFARLWMQTNDPNSAMTLLGLVTNHPRTDHETQREAEALVKELEDQLGTRMVQIGLQSGRGLNLDTIIDQIVTKR